MESKKHTWAATIVDPRLSVKDELKLWCRNSGDTDQQNAEINPLKTTLNCICGNHPWPAALPGLRAEFASAEGPISVTTVAGPPTDRKYVGL